MSTLTDQQREELQCREGFPVAVLDEQSQKVYYLISAGGMSRRVRDLACGRGISTSRTIPFDRENGR